MARQRALLLCGLALLLWAEQSLAIRSIGGGPKELHRPVHRWGKKGKTEEKTYTLEQMGRATFDPEFAARAGDIDGKDVGLEGAEQKSNTESDVRARLREIFPQLDTNHDGYISKEELRAWHAQNGQKAARRRTAQEFSQTDTDGDGFITLKEYMLEIGEEDEEEDLSLDNVTEIADLDDWLGTIKTAWKLADRDGDGKLSRTEFFEFQNPEESDNEKLKMHVIRQDIHLRDDDRDGKLNFDEFYSGYWSSFYLWTHRDESEKWTPELDREQAHLTFVQLDTSGDDKLDEAELRMAYDKLHPSEAGYAQLQSDHMFEETDSDKDGRLTLAEMLEHEHTFYSVAAEDDYAYHDEL